ncbi:hypothetical protein [Rubrobacter xylanophilus]|uniref:hypothetical protein n=1 Tax=Rubrobacter xylanophilus TaxID=49319 RepID=UPI001C640D02|nr:hypothetical protein [Rubrobacter xylanophilus]
MSRDQQQAEQRHHAVDASGSVVSITQVLAAGMASVAAALITSRFGVAGTIAGAALTTMIITAGSAILKAYLESFSGHVRSVPRRFRDSIGQRKRATQGGMAVYGRREGLAGRLRSALDWFAHLPARRRVSILAGALVPAVVAFAIAMSGVTLAELTGGRTLSCMVWGKCQVASAGGGEIAGVEQQSGPSTSVGALFSGGNGAATENQQLPWQQTPAGEQQQQSGGSSWFWEGEDQSPQQPVVTPQQPQQEQQQPVVTPQQPQQQQQQPVVTPQQPQQQQQQPVVTPQQSQQQQQQPITPQQQAPAPQQQPSGG